MKKCPFHLTLSFTAPRRPNLQSGSNSGSGGRGDTTRHLSEQAEDGARDLGSGVRREIEHTSSQLVSKMMSLRRQQSKVQQETEEKDRRDGGKGGSLDRTQRALGEHSSSYRKGSFLQPSPEDSDSKALPLPPPQQSSKALWQATEHSLVTAGKPGS